MTAGVERTNPRDFTAVTLAVLAALNLQIVRWEWHTLPWLLVAESLIVFAALAFALWYFECRSGSKPTANHYAIGLALLAFFLPPIIEAVLRTKAFTGEPNEVVGTLCVRNFMLVFAVFSRFENLQRTACLLSIFLMLVAMVVSNSVVAYVILALYAVVGMWWLMGNYWDRLQGKFADETRRRIPMTIGVSVPSVVLTVALLAGLGFGSSTTANVMWGFMPTSGGSGRYDPHSRDGVNDGDALVAAQDTAFSFGPVDSQLFLESQMPSLYDVFNDMYEEPAGRKTRTELAQSLASENMQTNHSRVARTKKSGREFSAVRRRRTQKRKKKLDDLESPAMLYVVGRTPLHLRMKVFNHFDGVEWSSSAEAPKLPELRPRRSAPTSHWLAAVPA